MQSDLDFGRVEANIVSQQLTTRSWVLNEVGYR